MNSLSWLGSISLPLKPTENAPFGSIKRKDLIRALKQAGFEGPYAGGKHEFLVKGNLRLTYLTRI